MSGDADLHFFAIFSPFVRPAASICFELPKADGDGFYNADSLRPCVCLFDATAQRADTEQR